MPLYNPPTAGGATDHGALTGLADDDHSQYATDTALAAADNDLEVYMMMRAAQ